MLEDAESASLITDLAILVRSEKLLNILFSAPDSIQVKVLGLPNIIYILSCDVRLYVSYGNNEV